MTTVDSEAHPFAPGSRGWRMRAFFSALACLLGLLSFPLTRPRPAPSPQPRQEGRRRPPSPAEGQRVAVSPPAFSWPPVPGARTYVLELSRSPRFEEGLTAAFPGLTRAGFVPREILPPGDWYWRTSAPGPGGLRLSPVRSFTVPRDAVPLPYPDWEEVLPAVPRERPRLFFPGPRLEEARRLARTVLREDVDTLEAACLRGAGRPLPEEPGFPPRGDARGPWSLEVLRTTRPPMDLMEACALVHLLRGSRRPGEEARRLLLHFFSWDPHGATAHEVFDEPGMWMMMRGTRAYDWTHALFTPAERRLIEGVMRVRAAQLLAHLRALPFESDPYRSHAGRLPGFLGECALSFVHEWPEAPGWLDHATFLYYTAFPAWGGDDGGWHEGPEYWRDYLSFALHFVVALRHATGVDLTRKPFFSRTPAFALYAAPPYRQRSPFGDHQAVRPMGQLLYAFSSLLRDPYARWYAEASGTAVGTELLGLATHDAGVAARPPSELPRARHFADVGLVSLHTALGERDADVSFLLRSSPFGSVSHGHADQNAFTVEAYGRALAIASGEYPWYGSPHHHLWTRATRAVNSVLVDGEGQATRSWQATGRITAFASGDDYDLVEAEAGPAYRGRLRRFRRTVVHVRPGVFVVLDDLEAPGPARFQWLLHACNPIGIGAAGRTLRVRNGPAAMRVVLLEPEELTLSQTGRYDPEPESEPGSWESTWHLTASTRTPSRRVRFLAVLLVHRPGGEALLPRVALERGPGTIAVRLERPGAGQDLVVFDLDEAAGRSGRGGVLGTTAVHAGGTAEDGTPRRPLVWPARGAGGPSPTTRDEGPGSDDPDPEAVPGDP